MTYIIIYRNERYDWFLWTQPFTHQDDALTELHRAARLNPEYTFEMHPLNDHLYEALLQRMTHENHL